jgi:tetratricopeptide (TPR) repeat protein
MKRRKIAFLLAGMLLVLMSMSGMAQEHTANIRGRITDGGKPAPNVQVVLTNDQGRKSKVKTDNKGEFFLVGLQYGNFKLEVIGADGEVLAKRDSIVLGEVDNYENLDLKDPNSGFGHAGGASSGYAQEDPWSIIGQSAPKLTKEQLAKIEADNKKIAGLNSLISEATNARQAQDWPKAENALKQLIAAAPDSNRWDFYMYLGEAQSKSNQYQDAVQTYDKGIQLAAGLASGTVPANSKIATLNPASAKAGMGRMLTAQGNDYLKMQKADESLAALKKASELDPSSGLAAYNLCGVAFTAQKVDEAKAACNKYLQIEPAGAHAAEVKDFLAQMGQK